MRTIKKTKAYSLVIGKLGKGCKQCINGEKLVLFITGLCRNTCYFCPISDDKKNKDIIYANERKVKHLNEIVEEVKISRAKGCGITGGDPLLRLDRAIKVIQLLKKNFGKNFHIHMYTPLNLINKNILKKLEKSGLDEIRFHPLLWQKDLWHKINFKIKIKKGIEIPIIPCKEKEIKQLLDFLDVDFVNLNELEIADNSFNKLIEMGFKQKNRMSYAVKGSEELAKRLLKYCINKKYDVHYCTALLKNKVQLGERLKRRAKNAAKPFDYITKEGSLIRGFIEAKNTKEVKSILLKEKVSKELIEIRKNEVLTSIPVVHDLKEKLKKYKKGYSEVYPTYDELEVERSYI